MKKVVITEKNKIKVYLHNLGETKKKIKINRIELKKEVLSPVNKTDIETKNI